MSQFRQWYGAIAAGILAAVGSLFGKLSGSFEGWLIAQAVCFLAMIGVNALMWTLFVRALADSESSLSVSIVTSACNYFIAALIGLVVFSETLPLLWWCGIAIILTGLYLIVADKKEEPKNARKEQ